MSRKNPNPKRNPVAFTKPPEPTFLRKLKEQIGYKDGPNIDTKREEMPDGEEDDYKDKDDEKPTVVVLRPGDLSAEEANKLKLFDEKEDEELDADGKIKFKKPLKRPSDSCEREKEIRKKIEKKESSMQKVSNKSLLSFDDEEDEDAE